MSEVELKEAKEQAKKVTEKLETLQQSLDSKADAEELVNFKDEIKSEISKLADKEYATKLQDQMDSVESKVSDFVFEKSKDVSFEEQIEKDLKGEKFEAYRKGNAGQGHMMELKVTANTSSNSFTETNSKIIPAYRDPIIGIDPRRPLMLTNIVQRKAMGQSDYIDWFERTSETTGTANTAEGAAYGQSDASWTSYKLPVELISDYIVVSKQKLADTTWMRGEIMDILSFNIPHKLETDLWEGDGTSNALYGLLGEGSYNAAKTFSLPSNSDPVSNASQYHVLLRAIQQVELGNTSNTKATGFSPNFIALHPSDYYNILSLKDQQDNSVRLTGLTIDNTGMRILGIPVMKTQRITEGTYLVGDASAASLYIRENTTIEMWDQNASDPIYGRVTITAVTRACFVIQNAKTYGFVTGTFAAGIPLVAAGS